MLIADGVHFEVDVLIDKLTVNHPAVWLDCLIKAYTKNLATLADQIELNEIVLNGLVAVLGIHEVNTLRSKMDPYVRSSEIVGQLKSRTPGDLQDVIKVFRENRLDNYANLIEQKIYKESVDCFKKKVPSAKA